MAEIVAGINPAFVLVTGDLIRTPMASGFVVYRAHGGTVDDGEFIDIDIDRPSAGQEP